MNYECNEMNFVMMHKEVVFQITLKCNLPTALNMMKISRVVMKQKAQSDDYCDVHFQMIQPGPSSIAPVASPASVQKSKQKSKAKKITQSDSVQMVSVSTQTKPEVVSVNLAGEDDKFNMFELRAMRQNYLITTIIEKDFQD